MSINDTKPRLILRLKTTTEIPIKTIRTPKISTKVRTSLSKGYATTAVNTACRSIKTEPVVAETTLSALLIKSQPTTCGINPKRNKYIHDKAEKPTKGIPSNMPRTASNTTPASMETNVNVNVSIFSTPDFTCKRKTAVKKLDIIAYKLPLLNEKSVKLIPARTTIPIKAVNVPNQKKIFKLLRNKNNDIRPTHIGEIFANRVEMVAFEFSKDLFQ